MKKSKQTLFIIFLIYSTFVFQAKASDFVQDVGVSIDSYNIILTTPDSLSLPATIIDHVNDKQAYGLYSTYDQNNYLEVSDYRLNGGFSVNAIVNNFINTNKNSFDPTQQIPATTTHDIINVSNSSKYSINGIIIFNTGEQSKVLERINPTSIKVQRAYNGYAKKEDPLEPLNNLPSSNTIKVTNSGNYRVNDELLLSNNEQVKVIGITDPTHIQVQRAINGSPIASHETASGINLPIRSNSQVTHIIPYQNFSIVTLANANTPSSVDTPATGNYPIADDSHTVSSILDCDWNNQQNFYSECDGSFINFTGLDNETSYALDIINGTSPTIGGRVGTYWITPALKLSIPVGTKAGHYTTTITFTLIPNP